MRILFESMRKGPPEQHGQNCVFGNMSGLADDRLHLLDGLLAHIRVEPTEKRSNNTGGVLSGQGIGGKGKDDEHPKQDGQPVKKEWTTSRHRFIKARAIQVVQLKSETSALRIK